MNWLKKLFKKKDTRKSVVYPTPAATELPLLATTPRPDKTTATNKLSHTCALELGGKYYQTVGHMEDPSNPNSPKWIQIFSQLDERSGSTYTIYARAHTVKHIEVRVFKMKHHQTRPVGIGESVPHSLLKAFE